MQLIIAQVRSTKKNQFKLW